ncbi:MAG: CBS domain-containing protein, partial [Planctomycetaceae bacterium]|nr:CBS domain-containing protein [Planctomycetaceae bacterium]
METAMTIKAAEIMTQRLVSAQAEIHVLDAIERLIAHRVSGIPILDRSGHLEGRFSERNAIAAMDLADISPASGCAGQFQRFTAARIAQGHPVLQSDMDVFQAVDFLLKGRISGAPVVGVDGAFLGVFSEQSAMHVFIGMCWEQMPSACVTAWISHEPERCISSVTTLDEIMDRFHRTAFRRLMVIRDGKLAGQVSRREALHAALECTRTSVVVSRDEAFRDGVASSARVGHWMQTDVPSVGIDDSVVSVAQTFVSTGARQLPVLNAGQMVGQISRSDLLR